MTNYEIAHWRRYGHNRAYISAADSTKLGYIDLDTGVHALEPGADADAITIAAQAWCAEHGIAMPGTVASIAADPPTAPLPVPEVTTASAGQSEGESEQVEPSAPPQRASAQLAPEWKDLAAHRPGEGVRQMAEAEWAAAKERSKVISFANRYVFDNHTDERAWRKGAEGEEFVGMKLNRLRDKGWHVLHSVPVGTGDSDIDHVAIGPGGVFTINSKNHASKKIWVAKYQMRVNGQPVPYLRNSRHEAARAKKLLEAQLGFEVPVMGCVVVLTGSLVPEVTYKQMPEDVRVLDKWDVPRWFKKRPNVLSTEQVDTIFDVARRSTTWSRSQ